MKTLREKLEATMAAAAFAEEGEVETARQLVADADVAEGGGVAAALRIKAKAGTEQTADPQSRGAVVAQERRRKAIGTMIVMGVLSAVLYAALLLYQDEVNGTFSRAGAYAVLPIVTAFAFSLVHGTFTGRFWTVLGIEASDRKGGAKHHA